MPVPEQHPGHEPILEQQHGGAKQAHHGSGVGSVKSSDHPPTGDARRVHQERVWYSAAPEQPPERGVSGTHQPGLDRGADRVGHPVHREGECDVEDPPAHERANSEQLVSANVPRRTEQHCCERLTPIPEPRATCTILVRLVVR